MKQEPYVLHISGAYSRDMFGPKCSDKEFKRKILESMGKEKAFIDSVIDDLDIEYIAGGADGEYDDGPVTLERLILKFDPEPFPPGGPEHPETHKEPEERELPKPRQTMLWQYYGDDAKEKQRIYTFDRFKSHIVKKPMEVYDEDGKKRNIEMYTVEDYDGRDQDSDDLMLDGYKTRLERLSRAHARDFSPYKREFKRLLDDAKVQIALRYDTMHDNNPQEAEEFREEALKKLAEYDEPEFKKRAIQALIDQDTEFIETNNYTYNARQTMPEVLKTAGKYGEKGIKAQISDDQSFATKFGLGTMNTLITLRNYTAVPVNKALGTFVLSPVYRKLFGVTQAKSKGPVDVDGFRITPMEDMIATSQKHSRGTFKNKPMHRYQARKSYFAQKEKEKLQKELDEKERENAIKDGKEYDENSVKRTSLGMQLKLAIIPRVKAITNYKEGNKAVTYAGLSEIEDLTAQREKQAKDKREQIRSLTKQIEGSDDCVALMEENARKWPALSDKIKLMIENEKVRAAKLKATIMEVKRVEIDSVHTDALSMSEHEKADREKVHLIISGAKTAATIGVKKFVSKYLYKEIPETLTTPDKTRIIDGGTKVVEETIVETVTTEVPGIDIKGMADISLEDLYTNSSGTLSYAANNVGRKIANTATEFRGAKFIFDGQTISGSDGFGFDPTILTNVQINPLTGKSSMSSVVQEILQNATGKQFSIEEINKMIDSGRISDIEGWMSSSKTGIPSGWTKLDDALNKVISNGKHIETKEVTRVVQKTIDLPDRVVTIPGIHYERMVETINPAVASAMGGLTVLQVHIANELLSHTKSQESRQIREPHVLNAMTKENNEKRELKNEELKNRQQVKSEKKKVKQIFEEYIKTKPISKRKEEVKIRYDIKSFARSTKPAARKYTYDGANLRNVTHAAHSLEESVKEFTGFTGTKRDIKHSGYDENFITGTTGVPNFEDDLLYGGVNRRYNSDGVSAREAEELEKMKKELDMKRAREEDDTIPKINKTTREEDDFVI